MKNTFGHSIKLTLFGESHGTAIGAVLDGLAPGLAVDEEVIARQLARRRPASNVDTPRQEPDHFQLLSGVFQGKTTGTPLAILIPNENIQSSDYHYGKARPAHADYAAFCKYHGYEDYRGGGHFSGRVTAALVAAGGILLPALEGLGISLGTHILSCGGVRDRDFNNLQEDLAVLAERDFPVLNLASGNQMTEKILQARQEQDSLGGLTQTALCGLPAGLGEPWFDSLEGLLAHALFSLGGIKGIEFGLGFALAAIRGSQSNDPFRLEKGRVITQTNHNGGINGGLSNGMPIIFQCAVKPTPSIAQEQKTIDFVKGENTTIAIEGRHDPAIVRRICPVIDSLTALVIADLLAQRFGTDVLRKGRKECNMD